jgi:hypothetical protein
MGKWFFLKVFSLVVSFCCVVYTAQYLKTKGFTGILPETTNEFKFAESHLGLRWCPEGVTEILMDSKLGPIKYSLETARRWVKDTCRVPIQSFNSKDINKKNFHTVLTARNGNGKEETLEAEESGTVFRHRGLLFFSKELSHLISQKPVVQLEK